MAKKQTSKPLAEIAKGLKTAKQRAVAIKKNPAIIALISSVTAEEADAAFAVDHEWFKHTIFKKESQIVQLAAVKHDPELIIWCIEPCKKALALAIQKDPELDWVAEANSTVVIDRTPMMIAARALHNAVKKVRKAVGRR